MSAMWIVVVIVLVLVLGILLFMLYRWKHSKNERNYTKWVDERVCRR